MDPDSDPDPAIRHWPQDANKNLTLKKVYPDSDPDPAIFVNDLQDANKN